MNGWLWKLMQDFLSVKNLFLYPSWKYRQGLSLRRQWVPKGKRLWKAGLLWMQHALASSLPNAFDSIGIKSSSETSLKNLAQKIKRAISQMRWICLYLPPPLCGDSLQGRSWVAFEGFSIFFLLTWSKVLSRDGQLQAGQREDAKRTRKYLGN